MFIFDWVQNGRATRIKAYYSLIGETPF